MTQALTLIGGRGRELPALLDRPAVRGAVRRGIVLAHGAGGTSQTPFIARAARGLSEAGWAVLRFDFGYATAGGRPSRADRPDAPEHVDFRAALSALADALPLPASIVAAGKSYGGRVASFVLAHASTRMEIGDGPRSVGDDPLLARVRGLLVFGYPIGGPGRERPADIEALRAVSAVGHPILIVQGSRDSLGPLPELESALEGVSDVTISVVEGGDHSYRGAGGPTVVARLENEAIGAAAAWLEGIAPSRPAP